MITLKQMEAFYWVGLLGSFGAAASKLNIAQSTISKRIQEFEDSLGLILLERAKRGGRLTLKGREMLPLVEEALRTQERIAGAAKNPLPFTGKFRIGLTELVALSWLADIVAAIRKTFPHIEIEPQVDVAANLYRRLGERTLDLAISARLPSEDQFKVVSLAQVEQVWACAPSFHRGAAPMPIEEFAKFPLLLQTSGSGLQMMLKSFLGQHGVRAKSVITCNSMRALAELAAAGFGVTCLPRRLYAHDFASGRLRVIKTDPAVPALEFVAGFREDSIGGISAEIAEMARQVCQSSSIAFTDRQAATPGRKTMKGGRPEISRRRA